MFHLQLKRENLLQSLVHQALANPRCCTSSVGWMYQQAARYIWRGKMSMLAIFRRRQVGLIYQFHNLIPTLNVVENITLPILMDKRKVNKERLNDLLNMLGLQERKTHLPNQLSGGQQQRVSIGRALMNAPAVMLADEPTGSLDSRNGHEIVKLLKESNQKYGQTLLLVTHDENIALQADRIIGISDGKVTRDERLVRR